VTRCNSVGLSLTCSAELVVRGWRVDLRAYSSSAPWINIRMFSSTLMTSSAVISLDDIEPVGPVSIFVVRRSCRWLYLNKNSSFVEECLRWGDRDEAVKGVGEGSGKSGKPSQGRGEKSQVPKRRKTAFYRSVQPAVHRTVYAHSIECFGSRIRGIINVCNTRLGVTMNGTTVPALVFSAEPKLLRDFETAKSNGRLHNENVFVYIIY
jgi:hypothetical protein